MDLSEVEGIIENKRPVPVPGSPDYVMGILNIRGTLTVLIDLRKLLKIEGSRKTDIILMNIEGKSIGLVVDKVEDIVDYSEEELSPVPVGNGTDIRMFSGILRKEEDTLILLDEEGILKALEARV